MVLGWHIPRGGKINGLVAGMSFRGEILKSELLKLANCEGKCMFHVNQILHL